MVLNFTQKNRSASSTISGNTSSISPSLKLKDLVNLSTNSTTSSYTDQRQVYNTQTYSPSYSTVLALNSSGTSGSATSAPNIATTPTTSNRTDGGSAGINPNAVIIGAVAIAAVVFVVPELLKK